MDTFSRRGMLQGLAAVGGMLATQSVGSAAAVLPRRQPRPGWVEGRLTGAEAVVETLLAVGCECVYGIPGAQENELWDTMKTYGLPYLLVTHEFSASCMADAYGRSKGKPGVLCVVPGPGVTNCLSGLGEALLDSSPVVAIVGDVAQGEKYRPFQVHSLNQQELLKPVTKAVLTTRQVGEIPDAIRQAFALAVAGEPGPVAVVIPYTQLIDAGDFASAPLAPLALPFDEMAYQRALALLAPRRVKVGIYAGAGCLDFADVLTALAERLQAPVATSVSGKGCIPENHPLAVGWGYGPQGTLTAERVFSQVDTLLAIGVKFSEVSTGFYSNPQKRHVIHVDAQAENLGRILRTDVCVHADAGLFLQRLLAEPAICRPKDEALIRQIAGFKAEERKLHATIQARCAVDPMQVMLALRRHLGEDALLFVDVTVSCHLAAEAYKVCRPRTWFTPADNQSMGWAVAASIGAQKVHPQRTVACVTGDGCFLMSGTELSTAGRENLPVKVFVLDDQAYQYMQRLQKPAYLRTTATILARLDYAALAKGFGVGYLEIASHDQLDTGIRAALAHPGPVLTRIVTDYSERKIRWVEAVRQRFTKELTAAQKLRFLARLGSRTLHPEQRLND